MHGNTTVEDLIKRFHGNAQEYVNYCKRSNVEFKINEYITLSLEEGKTIIYVDGEKFNQCKFLLLNIPVEKISNFSELKSIDEAAEELDRSMEGNSRKKVQIPPEVEFWGHCSNLQVWVENDYDTRLLHSHLSFPLLKRLTEIGDTKAKQVFKKEIAERFSSGNASTSSYLLNEGYLEFFNQEEREVLINSLKEISFKE